MESGALPLEHRKECIENQSGLDRMAILNRPRSSGPYPDRDIACQEAVEQSFLLIAQGLKPDDITAAAGGKLVPQLMTLARQAESVGWSLEEAEVAISDLSQNLLDDMAQM